MCILEWAFLQSIVAIKYMVSQIIMLVQPVDKSIDYIILRAVSYELYKN